MKYSHKRDKKSRRYFKILSAICFAFSVSLMILTFIFSLPVVQKHLGEINAWLVRIEHYIAGFDWLKAFAILLFLFFLKSIVPIIPFSVMFVSAGMVFPAIVAVLISTIGVAFLCTVKFFWGRKYGGGSVHKVVFKSRRVTKFMGFNDKGNRWILGLLCFIPVFPVGAVSRAYGATKMSFSTFITLIVLGIMPRIILWSFVGVNIFEPFTVGFIAPFIILLVISGVSLLILDALLQGERIEKYEKESDKQS